MDETVALLKRLLDLLHKGHIIQARLVLANEIDKRVAKRQYQGSK